MIVRLPTLGADDAVSSELPVPRGTADSGGETGCRIEGGSCGRGQSGVCPGLRRLLESAGHEVHIYNDGVVALSQAPAFGPDVILLDLGLPGMDGYEFARRMREDESFAHVKIVVLSGYASEEDQQRSREVGVDEHLAKPVRFSELLRIVA